MAGNTTKYAPASSNDIIFSARKNTSGSISKGEAVYVAGFHADGYYLVEKAKADSASTMPSVGIAENAFSDTETGSILISGVLKSLDTSSWSVDDELYVSSATAGALTNTKPTSTTDIVEKVGVVVKSHASDGVIQVYNAGAAVHANRTGGAFHTVASSSEAGFMPQSKLDATADPTVNDDSGDGYEIGSRWINTSSDKEWVCTDASSGAAVWEETTLCAHASCHASGGNDAVKLDDLSAPDDNTDLNASTSKHGLCPKLGGGETNFFRADGTWAEPPSGSPASFGELYHKNTSGYQKAVSADTWTKFDNFTVGNVSSASNTVTGSASTDDLTIGSDGGGTYRVSISAIYDINDTTAVTEGAVFVNGTEQTDLYFRRPNSSCPIMTPQAMGIITLSNEDVVDFRIRSDGADTFTLYAVNLSIDRICIGSSITYDKATGTSELTTTSSTDVLVTGMTITPDAGTYIVRFSGVATNSTGGESTMSIYAGGTREASSESAVTPGNNDNFGFCCDAVVTVNGSQAIEGKFKAASGTAKIYARRLIILKVA